MKKLQLQLPKPGQWDQFALTAIYQDAGGYTRTDRYTQDDIPADQAPALAAAVTAIASMGENWQATQAWARLGDDRIINNPAADEGAINIRQTVLLTIEAVNPSGGRKNFTPSEHMQLILTDPAAVAFFKHFTK